MADPEGTTMPEDVTVRVTPDHLRSFATAFAGLANVETMEAAWQ